MISINDLIHARPYPEFFGPVEMDPLQETDALQEAQLLDSRLCHLTSTAALLFEMRTSLQFDVGNSALLVVRGLRSFDWKSPSEQAPLAALTVVSSVADRLGDFLRMRFEFFPKVHLALEGHLAEFYVLEVEGIGDVPPDYSSVDLKNIQGALPSWSSACSLLQASTSN
ncbi:hypothetical protein [Streptomyces sp. NRRL F-4428]|uniref:hypothetical protein n=1 Tax=Streptomyces sp. NRRL F-4428 TaxID=1609137 RepID=UPI0005ECF239|nr:hypothetical protein [Streptomyces sp. NRRL F-4428]KJK52439.1 hypothetical protein UK14_08830 [Streptomyces sp. NRRL F-4428]